MENIERILRGWLKPLHGDWPQLYLVGGAVRDHLLSRPVKDIDLMCQDAQGLAKRLAAAKNAALVPFQKKVDEPCYRVVDRQNRDVFIDIVPIRGNTVEDDLGCRDFTINAIAIRFEEEGTLGNIIDPFNGSHDLQFRLVRFTSPEAFIADPLRILRAVRFASELDFAIEKNTSEAMKAQTCTLETVPGERIVNELYRIFATEHGSAFIRLMDDLDVLEVVFPEIKPMKGCTQNSYHHLDVWQHSLAVLEECENIVNRLGDIFGPVCDRVRDNLKPDNRLPLLKMSAILHDVAKPATRAVDGNTGRITFYDHDRKGEEIVSAITQRLRMSKQDQEFVQILVAQHMHTLGLSRPEVKPTTALRWFRKLKDDMIPLIILAMADVMSTLGPEASKTRIERHLQWSKETVNAYYGNIKKRLERQNLIRGKDLIALGIPPGPEMGSILQKLREAQDAGLIKDRQEALALAKKLRIVYEFPFF